MMGEEYFYCWKCRTRLSGSDFEHGRALQIRDRITCLDCVKDLLPPLPLKEQEEVLLMVKEAREKARRPPSRSAISVPGEEAPAALELPPPARRRYSRSRSGPILWAFLIVAAVLAAIGVAWKLRPAEPVPADTPRRSLPAPSQPSPPSPTEAAAREALHAADEFARASPDDFHGQEERYRKALQEAEGTPVQNEVRARLEAVQKKKQEAVAAELAALDGQVQQFCRQEEYRKAVDLLEEARGRHPGSAWANAVDQRILRVNQEAWAAYAPLRDKVADARRRNAREEIREIEERVKNWGMPALIEDLQKGLATPPPATPPSGPPPEPQPPPPTEAAAYRKAWEQAASWARLHDFPRALGELEEVSRSIQDPSLRSEAAADLENFRRAAEVRREAVETLSKWPRDRRVHLSWWDGEGQKAEFEGFLHRVDSLSVEIVWKGAVLGIPLGELLPGTFLEEILSGRSGRDPANDAQGVAVLCLLTGDLEGARKAAGRIPGFRIPEAYQAFARRAAEEEARAPARPLFWAAEQEFRLPGARGRSLEKITTLLSEHAASPLVRRNRGFLMQRLEAGRDYFFPAEAMTPSGMFTTASYPKVEACWTSETDVPATRAKDNFVEFEFYALPELTYRCWVQVGACCAETFTFFYQTTDSGEAEPGAGRGLPARHQILFLKRFHAQHGGPKEPSRWEWVPIPLPRYSVVGIKKVRLLSDHQGFSVARAIVSAVRQAPPRDPELKELERALAAERPPTSRETAGESPPAPPEPVARTWRPLFDGRTVEFLTRESAPAWRVEEGTLVPVAGRHLPGETREAFDSGEIRIRFEFRELESLFFKILHGPQGSYRLSFDENQLRGLEGRTLELIFTCRKEGVTAELDGKPVVLARTGQPERGTLQFGAVGKTFRILSIEHR